MYDHPAITSDGTLCSGSRYLRTGINGVYQTVFYHGLSRSDAAAYSRFAADDPAMNLAAEHLLREMVAEADRARHKG